MGTLPLRAENQSGPLHWELVTIMAHRRRETERVLPWAEPPCLQDLTAIALTPSLWHRGCSLSGPPRTPSDPQQVWLDPGHWRWGGQNTGGAVGSHPTKPSPLAQCDFTTWQEPLAGREKCGQRVSLSSGGRDTLAQMG